MKEKSIKFFHKKRGIIYTKFKHRLSKDCAVFGLLAFIIGIYFSFLTTHTTLLLAAIILSFLFFFLRIKIRLGKFFRRNLKSRSKILNTKYGWDGTKHFFKHHGYKGDFLGVIVGLIIAYILILFSSLFGIYFLISFFLLIASGAFFAFAYFYFRLEKKYSVRIMAYNYKYKKK